MGGLEECDDWDAHTRHCGAPAASRAVPTDVNGPRGTRPRTAAKMASREDAEDGTEFSASWREAEPVLHQMTRGAGGAMRRPPALRFQSFDFSHAELAVEQLF